ncbi:glycosyltransferase family 2 protein [Candidatus Shapirobacteria bacterium CG07_land_8_20_14_0_80_39_18]|uniref:Glycosyltransferase family 2 protein n=1 Tax=Candidatus Shapirobacteria bacterium CG07_land_8_20_14_0_80_39_18 TaxID=1974882 RepID=A0A2M6YS39_9BACT|nr:MAG: glycosyltransferase family 2 protein [Candidatus Shapirobacteria bacterium CG07_land_8_20_14_0_80_39_18]
MEAKKLMLSIVILSWNTEALLKQCLESLEEGCEGIGGCEVVVVDNGSTDGSSEMVRKYQIRNTKYKIRLIENQSNLGFAKGNNIGIKEARGEYIMLLNSDTIVQKGSLKKMVDFLDQHGEISVVGPKLLNQDGTPQSSCGQFPNLWVVFIMLFKEHFGGSRTVRYSPAVSGEVDWLMGAAFVAREKVFKKVGFLDERMFMYMEEVEWFYRVRKAGLKAYFLKEAEIVHLGRGSSSSGKKEPILNIYKGLLHFYKVHKSPLELFILRLMLKVKALISLLIGDLKNDNYLKQTYGQAIKIN